MDDNATLRTGHVKKLLAAVVVTVVVAVVVSYLLAVVLLLVPDLPTAVVCSRGRTEIHATPTMQGGRFSEYRVGPCVFYNPTSIDKD
jgi:hypothetical protein